MVRSRLRNAFLKHPTNDNKKNYWKKIHFCVILLRKEKKITLKILTLKTSVITKPFRKLSNHYFLINENFQ